MRRLIWAFALRICSKTCICAVWSKSSLGAFWLAKDTSFFHADKRLRGRAVWFESSKICFPTLRVIEVFLKGTWDTSKREDNFFDFMFAFLQTKSHAICSSRKEFAPKFAPNFVFFFQSRSLLLGRKYNLTELHFLNLYQFSLNMFFYFVLAMPIHEIHTVLNGLFGFAFNTVAMPLSVQLNNICGHGVTCPIRPGDTVVYHMTFQYPIQQPVGYCLTNLCRMDSSTFTLSTGPLPISGCLVAFY